MRLRAEITSSEGVVEDIKESEWLRFPLDQAKYQEWKDWAIDDYVTRWTSNYTLTIRQLH